MKTALSNVITPFSLLHPLPNRNIYITQLRIRPARLLITSALPAQAAHADNKQWNFKRVHQKKGGEIKIRLRLINNSWLQKFTYDLKVGLTSYSVNVSQEVRQAALQQAQTGKRCHQFFRMQKMARWCNYSLFKSIHFSRFSPRSPAMATRVNMAMLHTGSFLQDKKTKTKTESKSEVDDCPHLQAGVMNTNLQQSIKPARHACQQWGEDHTLFALKFSSCCRFLLLHWSDKLTRLAFLLGCMSNRAKEEDVPHSYEKKDRCRVWQTQNRNLHTVSGKSLWAWT